MDLNKDKTTCKTGENRRKGTFAKGDPRINRKGRPRISVFEELRKAALEIANEEVKGKKRVMIILNKMARSNNFQMQQKFLDVAYGKIPDDINVNNKIIYVEPPEPTNPDAKID
jgi:hypothetical protein